MRADTFSTTTTTRHGTNVAKHDAHRSSSTSQTRLPRRGSFVQVVDNVEDDSIVYSKYALEHDIFQ